MGRMTKVRVKKIRCSECEDFTKLVNCDTGEVITYGDYYHDKITEYIDGFIFGLEYAGVEVVLEDREEFICDNCDWD